MKRLFVCLLALFSCFVYAENLKLSIAGPERRYNQLRITNNTSYSDFDCNAYFLEEKEGKMVIKDTLGVFHLKGANDTDTCAAKIRRKDVIGIALPAEFGKVAYTITYTDLPFFDIVEVVLTDAVSDRYGDNPIGKEF